MSENGEFECRCCEYTAIGTEKVRELITHSLDEDNAQISTSNDGLEFTSDMLDISIAFRQVSRDEAESDLFDMPYNDETAYPIPLCIFCSELEAMPGMEFVSEKYGERGVLYAAPGAELRFNSGAGDELTLISLKSTGGCFWPAVCGITHGMSLEEVLSRFPNGTSVVWHGVPEQSIQIHGDYFAGAMLSERAEADEYRGQTQLALYSWGKTVGYIFDSENTLQAVVGTQL